MAAVRPAGVVGVPEVQAAEAVAAEVEAAEVEAAAEHGSNRQSAPLETS
jgi:hypothetical protein